MLPFRIQEATQAKVPIIVSIPHCGVLFPEEIAEEYKPNLISKPDDTDWFVDKLYDFVPAMGITMITAVNSRWVIDLNRDRNSKPLYTDGRIITALCPTTTFLGEPIYRDERSFVSENEVERRYVNYYKPYHDKIQSLLNERIKEFGQVLLWDCHSIRQIVPTIQSAKFPDMILGDSDEKSAAKKLIEAAHDSLSSSDYSLNHNHPFKGGTITRTFGKPEINQHALQLEMTKVNYMNDEETAYDHLRSEKMKKLLSQTFQNLISVLLNE
ncbi:MAG TPA: N-formylglutamate amidohydrolase [Ohtaekwangia sp.]